jgi:hypothetical protein
MQTSPIVSRRLRNRWRGTMRSLPRILSPRRKKRAQQSQHDRAT